ncbi:MAG TPA: hypothetical protein VJG66_03390 [Patescibacteria group bacterium]|nr:hypothetical protein [Patescibacteria group bacterium]
MLWKIYVWIFGAINLLSVVSFQYNLSNLFGLLSLILSVGLNIAVFSYAYQKPVFSKIVLGWLFKINIGLIGLFLLFEFITFLQEIIGAGISLPTSGLVSIIAGFPALPALYATYKLANAKTTSKKKRRR